MVARRLHGLLVHSPVTVVSVLPVARVEQERQGVPKIRVVPVDSPVICEKNEARGKSAQKKRPPEAGQGPEEAKDGIGKFPSPSVQYNGNPDDCKCLCHYFFSQSQMGAARLSTSGGCLPTNGAVCSTPAATRGGSDDGCLPTPNGAVYSTSGQLVL